MREQIIQMIQQHPGYSQQDLVIELMAQYPVGYSDDIKALLDLMVLDKQITRLDYVLPSKILKLRTLYFPSKVEFILPEDTAKRTLLEGIIRGEEAVRDGNTISWEEVKESLKRYQC